MMTTTTLEDFARGRENGDLVSHACYHSDDDDSDSDDADSLAAPKQPVNPPWGSLEPGSESCRTIDSSQTNDSQMSRTSHHRPKLTFADSTRSIGSQNTVDSYRSTESFKTIKDEITNELQNMLEDMIMEDDCEDEDGSDDCTDSNLVNGSGEKCEIGKEQPRRPLAPNHRPSLAEANLRPGLVEDKRQQWHTSMRRFSFRNISMRRFGADANLAPSSSSTAPPDAEGRRAKWGQSIRNLNILNKNKPEEQQLEQAAVPPPPISTQSKYGYDLGIRLFTSDEGLYTAPLPNQHLSDISLTVVERHEMEKCHREYISVVDVRTLFSGIEGCERTASRLATIQIRPDVQARQVMKSVAAVVTDIGGTIAFKGETRVIGSLPPDDAACDMDDDNINDTMLDEPVLPGVDLDIQLCVKKTSRYYERVLVIQILPLEGQGSKPQALGKEVEEDKLEDTARFLLYSESNSDGTFTKDKYPCLTDEYGLVVKAGWKLICRIIREMDKMVFSSCTLHTKPFTSIIDPRYAYQLRVLCRDIMLNSLQRISKELDGLLRNAEKACSNLLKLLEPAFEQYDIEFPEPMIFTDFDIDEQDETDDIDLDKQSNTILERIIKRHFRTPGQAMQLLTAKFYEVDEEELQNRKHFKENEIVDRLAIIRTHEHTHISLLQEAFTRNVIAKQEAENFHSAAAEHDHRSTYLPSDQVPILKFKLILATSEKYTNITGMCYCTPYQILISHKQVPFGSSQTNLMDMKEAKVAIWRSAKKKRFRENPDGVILTWEEGELSFVPFIGAGRFKEFVETMNRINIDEEEGDYDDKSTMLEVIGEEKEDGWGYDC